MPQTCLQGWHTQQASCSILFSVLYCFFVFVFCLFVFLVFESSLTLIRLNQGVHADLGLRALRSSKCQPDSTVCCGPAMPMMNNVYLLFFCYCHSRTFFGFSVLLLLVSARAEQLLHPYLARPEKSSSYLQHTRNSQQTSHKVSSKGNGPATPSFTHHL